MKDIFNEMTEAQAILVSSIISAIIGASISLVVVFINRSHQKKNEKKERNDAVKRYANQIILSAELLAWRIKEILEYKGAYLLPNAPKNGFFKYKFDSTVYRLCALIGWLQAVKREQSYFEVVEIEHYKPIQKAVQNFQKILADGGHVEVSILDELSILFRIDVSSLNPKDRAMLGVEIERHIFNYIPDNVKLEAKFLDKQKQYSMIEDILNSICKQCKQSKIPRNVIEENINTAINEIARNFCWIYRDWQSAIGDEMIIKIQNANKRFDIIGFGDFLIKHNEKESWTRKVDGLFCDLDVPVDDRFDARVEQLREIYKCLITLINSFVETIPGRDTISEDSLEKLIGFNKTLKVLKKK